ncbi:MAG: lipid-A-disaccharide synthase [Bacteroidales bacterium]|jgi:lipid-A-disaccharide synthase
MRYFIIAGEKSGDLHGSNLIRGIKHADPDPEIICWGGELMAEAGAKLLMHYRNLAFMGFVTVLLNAGKVLRNMSLCRKQIKEYLPDVVILIDFPGFNLRIAEYSKSLGIRVFYYISPKLWAWKESRVEKVRRFVDRMFIIFPFEAEFYRKHNIHVEYYGNPLVDEIERKKHLFGDRDAMKLALGLDERPIITILAGSRKHEVEHILPPMLIAARNFKGYQFILAGVNSITAGFYKKIAGNENIRLIVDRTYELLWISEAALVKSGTSTLEAALMGTPQVVCYSGDAVSFAIAKRLVKVKYISLVNLIGDKQIVMELLQDQNNPENITIELKKIIKGGPGRDKMLSDYDELGKILGPAGASDRIALEMVKLLKKS